VGPVAPGPGHHQIELGALLSQQLAGGPLEEAAFHGELVRLLGEQGVQGAAKLPANEVVDGGPAGHQRGLGREDPVFEDGDHPQLGSTRFDQPAARLHGVSRLVRAVEGDADAFEPVGRVLGVGPRGDRYRRRRAGEQTFPDASNQEPSNRPPARGADDDESGRFLFGDALELACGQIAGDDLGIRHVDPRFVRELAQDCASFFAHAGQLFTGRIRERVIRKHTAQDDRGTRALRQQPAQRQRVKRSFRRVDRDDDVLWPPGAESRAAEHPGGAGRRSPWPQVVELRLVRQAPGAELATASIDGGAPASDPHV